MSRRAKAPRVDHHATAAQLREHPHTWMTVGDYRSGITAKDVARRIRNGIAIGSAAYGSPYRPAGEFEARTEFTEDGTRIIARFIGAPRKGQPPMTDADRIRGQIERGEILVGAEAARRIAARHQAAYGNAVWGSENDTAWADAVASLPSNTKGGNA